MLSITIGTDSVGGGDYVAIFRFIIRVREGGCFAFPNVDWGWILSVGTKAKRLI
jgi:hypothetical protein